jgi:hypothetical protein
MADIDKSWFSETDLPLAKEDRTVTIEVAGVDVERKVIAGTHVPPDLIEAYEAAGGKADTSSPPAVGPRSRRTAASE